MTDDDFARAELDFKDVVNRFIEVCNEYGVNAKDRIDDILFDALIGEE